MDFGFPGLDSESPADSAFATRLFESTTHSRAKACNDLPRPILRKWGSTGPQNSWMGPTLGPIMANHRASTIQLHKSRIIPLRSLIDHWMELIYIYIYIYICTPSKDPKVSVAYRWVHSPKSGEPLSFFVHWRNPRLVSARMHPRFLEIASNLGTETVAFRRNCPAHSWSDLKDFERNNWKPLGSMN